MVLQAGEGPGEHMEEWDGSWPAPGAPRDSGAGEVGANVSYSKFP